MELKTNHKLAVAVSREQMNNIILPLTDTDVFCFPKSQNVFSYSVVMLMRHHHHLTSYFDKIIADILAAGLTFKWAKDSGRIIKNDNMLTDVEQVSVHVKLSLEHVQGTFLVIAIGYLLALIIFILEWAAFLFDKYFSTPLSDRKELSYSENRLFVYVD